MANKLNSLAHTKWLCKYHIVFIPKYRRKAIFNQYRRDLRDYIRLLCKYKGVEIIEGHMMPDHVHLLVSIPPMMGGYDSNGARLVGISFPVKGSYIAHLSQ